MSSVFLDSVFKCHTVHMPDPDSRESLIDKICYDELSNVYLEKLQNSIANTILSHGLYKVPGGRGLPQTSRAYKSLYHNGKSNVVELTDILQGLQVRVKQNEINYRGNHIRVGHFRFKYLNLIPVQLVIFLEVAPGVLVMLIKSLPKLANSMITFLVEEMGCIVNNLNFEDKFLKQIVNDSFNMTQHNYLTVGDYEFHFQSIKTIGSALSSIIINVKKEDFAKFRNREDNTPILESIYAYLKKNTALDFNELSLTRIRCNLFLMTSDGRIKFTNAMSYLDNPTGQQDDRPSIWYILVQICNLAY